MTAADGPLDEHRAIVERRFPQLATRTFTPIGEGWTSFTYDVNGEWIVQLPRTPYAAERLRAQAAVLPGLAREVSAPVPAPEPAAEPAAGEPPALVYRRLEGAPVSGEPEGYWPERLGRFLYDLHSVPPEFLGLRALTPAALRAREREEWASLREQVMSALTPTDLDRLDATLRALLDRDALWSFAPCLTHGDLGPEHVLVDPRGDLSGILDWEEVGIGDPAADFAWWLHQMPAVGERALAAYGGAPDRGFRERARLRWALMPWHDVAHGMRTGQEGIVASGLAGVAVRRP